MCEWPDGRVSPLLFDATPLLPSAVFAAEDGRLLVGRDAERSARIDPAAFEPHPKQRIDDGVVLLGVMEHPVAELIAAVLRRCLDEACRVLGEPPTRAVLTHPAGWGPRRKAVLAEAAARAGLARIALVDEPTAAALYFSRVMGQQVAQDAAVVVYDFGGGTFDVAVVQRHRAGWKVLDSGGFDDVGGADLDAQVVDALRAALPGPDPGAWQRLTNPQSTTDRRHRRLLWEDARAAKEQLTRNPTATIHVPILDAELYFTREEFERQARPWLDRTVRLTATTLDRSGIARDRIAGVFLVGGSSRIPLVPTLLHRHLGIAPTVIEQPELVVAQGSLHAIPRTADPDATYVLASAWTPEPDAAAIGVALVPPAPGAPAGPPTAPSSPAPTAVSHPAGIATSDRGDASAPQVALPRKPASSKRRRNAIVVASVLTAIIAAAVIVALLNRSPKLTEQGKRNANAFTSTQLRSFAERWLNDLNECESAPPNQSAGAATELVHCESGTWKVNFRAYENFTNRGDARKDRRIGYQKEHEVDLTGRGPGSGVRVDYIQDGRLVVIYWDDENALVSGDLYSDQLDRSALSKIWAKHVT